MQASVNAAQATLKQTQWQLAQTEIRAPVSGWVTNLTTRIGDYADTGKPLFALVDSHSFYVIGYFEETKLRHIREGAPAQITLYSDNKTLRGHVSSIGRAIYDQSVESDSSLIPDVKPNVPGFVSPNAFPSALRWIKFQAMSRWCRAPSVALP